MADPLFFIYLGDRNYENTSTNSPAIFHATYDRIMRSHPQARLHAEIPIVYVWDDHDYGANNSNGASSSKPAVAAVYRSRVPSYTLPHATAVYHTFDVGRVRFIVTDQRSEASPNTDTDNSSKTMLGSTQKTWFKSLLSSSSGMVIVWICPRWFRAGAAAGADSWSGFTTERTELVDYIKANCHGRVIVISADLHTMGIDDGTNHDFATGGGEPLKTFQAAALDQTPVSGGETYSHGEYTNTGQWGTMEVTDSGGSTVGITWTGYNSVGTQLVQYAFSISV
jgi:alkaline phosphatase D